MGATSVNLIPLLPDSSGWVREHRFHPERGWLLDYAHPEAKLAVEIHGSVWSQGRHTRGRGFQDDREKMNAAQMMGWIVLEYSTDQIQREWGRVADEIMSCFRQRRSP